MAYLRLLFAGLPVVTAYNFAAAALRALGDGRTPLIAMAAASVTNIALDFWFVLGFRWGVQGAAAATVLAQCLAAGCCIWRLCRIEALRLSRAGWKPDQAQQHQPQVLKGRFQGPSALRRPLGDEAGQHPPACRQHDRRNHRRGSQRDDQS